MLKKIINIQPSLSQEISLTSIPDGEPTVIITPANVTKAIFPGMKVDVTYQFAVQAFTAMGDGPLSSPTQIRIDPKNVVITNTEDLINKKETRY